LILLSFFDTSLNYLITLNLPCVPVYDMLSSCTGSERNGEDRLKTAIKKLDRVTRDIEGWM